MLDGLDGQGVHAIVADGSKVFAGTDAGGVRFDGVTWQRFGSGLDRDKVFAPSVAGRELLAGWEKARHGREACRPEPRKK
jgi:hypothetical protein